MASSLKNARWSPVPLPPGGYERDMSRFPTDTTRNAVNQGGVGAYPNGTEWHQNPTTMPFTAQPGPVYGCALNSNQAYRQGAGWLITVQPGIPSFPQPWLQAGVPRSGGVPTANAIQARMAQLIAMRQRVASKRGKLKN